MLFRDKFVYDGNWLFRWRSFIPLIIAPVLILAVRDFAFPGGGERFDDFLEVFCVALAALGLAIRAYAIGHAAPNTSGANTRRQVADDLNTTGLYSVVRHPLYLGNAVIWLAIALFDHALWAVAIAVLFFALYYERIMMAEERFLEDKFGDRFRDWARATPAFVPDFRKWIPPARPFDWRAVVRRDHAAVLAVVAIFTAIEVGGDLVLEGELEIDTVWAALFLAAIAYYLGVTVLRRKTKLLRSPRLAA